MFIFLIYLPLLLKGLFFLTRLEKISLKIPGVLGRVEYFIAPWRDTLLAFCMLSWSVYSLAKGKSSLCYILLIALAFYSFFNRFERSKLRLLICHWILRFDAVEPHAFFDIYFRSIGSFSNQLPLSVPEINYSYIDYRSDRKPKHTLIPLLQGLLDTATLAKLAILAMKKLEGDEGINAFDSFARIWGARFIAQAHLRLKTVSANPLPPLEGKVLLVFNHKSYLDFVINFFALGNLRISGRHLRPRFIAAKDHFIDNPFVYSWMGLGKCIEKAGMIFINRKKGKGWLAMKEAADKLIHSDVEVAVYPQGTRAWGMLDEKGQRMDAGFYTTFSPRHPEDTRGHIKIGTPQLILDTALQLKKENKPPLHVLFIGLDGTATVGPKGSFKIQTESDITIHIGLCWKVQLPEQIELKNPEGQTPSCEAHENYLAQIEAIHEKIDREMEKSIRRHSQLIERILNDPRVAQDKESLKRLKDFLERADATESILPFVVLDRLYALPPPAWEKHLKHYSQLAWQEADKSMWEEFSLRVSRELVQ